MIYSLNSYCGLPPFPLSGKLRSIVSNKNSRIRFQQITRPNREHIIMPYRKFWIAISICIPNNNLP